MCLFSYFLCLGCEFFKDYKDRDYTAEGLVFNWNQVQSVLTVRSLNHSNLVLLYWSDATGSPLTGLCGRSFDNPCVLHPELEHWLDSVPGTLFSSSLFSSFFPLLFSIFNFFTLSSSAVTQICSFIVIFVVCQCHLLSNLQSALEMIHNHLNWTCTVIVTVWLNPINLTDSRCAARCSNLFILREIPKIPKTKTHRCLGLNILFGSMKNYSKLI